MSAADRNADTDAPATDGGPARAGGAWRRFVDRPQSLKARNALLQLHLWLALATSLYIVVICLSGSAVVFRREVSIWLIPRFVPSTEGVALSGDALKAAAERVYSGQTIAEIIEPRRPGRPAAVRLTRNGQERERLFDPYALTDMGSTYPLPVRIVEWLVDLHDNLLAGSVGRKINGVAGAVITVIALSGLVLWWPGRRRWRRSLIVDPSWPVRPVSWQLHSAMGFWSSALLLVWALTAVYFAFPGPVEALIDATDPDPTDFDRPGEAPLKFLIALHFGRFGNLGVRTLWVILGLIPIGMLVTGLIMWLRRTRRPGGVR